MVRLKTDLFFNIFSLSVHTLPPAMLESLDPSGIEALIIVLKNSSTAATLHLTSNASQLGAFSCSETENNLTELDLVNTDGGQEV